MADVVGEIKKLIKEDKLVIGTERTMKLLKTGKVQKVYLATNCPEDVRESVEHYAEIGGVEVVDSGLQNTDLGDICKKPFQIAVIALPK